MRPELETLWLAYRANELDAAEDARLAQLLEDEPGLLAAVLTDLETEALLQAATVDDAAFVRSTRERLAAEADGTHFLSVLQERLAATARRRWWLAAGLTAAAAVLLALVLPLVHTPSGAADDSPERVLSVHDRQALVLDRAQLLVQGPARYRTSPGFVLLEGQVDCVVAPGGEGFSLRTPLAAIEVLGTRFTVGATTSQTLVTVAHGRVQIRREDGARSILGPGLRTAFTADGALVPQLIRPGVAALISRDPARDAPCLALARRLEHDGWRVHLVDQDAPQLPLDTELVVPLQPADSSRMQAPSADWQHLPVLCLDPSINRWLGISADRDNAYILATGSQLDLRADPRACTAGLGGRLRVQSGSKPLHWAEARPGVETIATWPGQPERGVILLRPRDGQAPPRLFVGINPGAAPTAAGWALLRASAAWLVAEARATSP